MNYFELIRAQRFWEVVFFTAPPQGHSRIGPWTWRHTHTLVDKQKRKRTKHTSNMNAGWSTETGICVCWVCIYIYVDTNIKFVLYFFIYKSSSFTLFFFLLLCRHTDSPPSTSGTHMCSNSEALKRTALSSVHSHLYLRSPGSTGLLYFPLK